MAAMERLLICVLVAVMFSCCDCTSEKVEQAEITSQTPENVPRVEPKVLKFGTVTAYLDEQRVEVDVEVCLKEGILEYLAVAEDGKAYESVLIIQCEPCNLHMALLAIGCEPGDVPKEARGDFLDESIVETNEKPESLLELFLEWTDHDKPVRIRAEELLFSIDKEQTLKQTHWTFTGSYFSQDDEGREYYEADVGRSVIGVWYDPSAVINLPLASGNPYRGPSGFCVNTAVLPKDSKAKLVIRPCRFQAESPESPQTR